MKVGSRSPLALSLSFLCAVCSGGRRCPGAPLENMLAFERAWRELQVDLANRSIAGRLVVADKRGHDVPREAPDVVWLEVLKLLRQVSRAQR